MRHTTLNDFNSYKYIYFFTINNIFNIFSMFSYRFWMIFSLGFFIKSLKRYSYWNNYTFIGCCIQCPCRTIIKIACWSTFSTILYSILFHCLAHRNRFQMSFQLFHLCFMVCLLEGLSDQSLYKVYSIKVNIFLD